MLMACVALNLSNDFSLNVLSMQFVLVTAQGQFFFFLYVSLRSYFWDV